MMRKAAETCITTKQLLDFGHASSQPGNPLGAAARVIGGCIAVRSTALPDVAPYNKGRAFGPGSLDRVEEVERFYGEVRLVPRIEISSTDTTGAALLTGRGYHLKSSALTLSLEPSAAQKVDGSRFGLISEVGPGDGDDAYLVVIASGYGLVPGTPRAEMITVEHRTPGLRRFLVEDGGRHVAAGALFIDGPTAYLAGATTLTSHRRHGHQSSLINHRLDVARLTGCNQVVVTVAPNSESHSNLSRFGFAAIHVRHLWES